MNIKTNITKLHYNKNPKGLLFQILKFFSLFYGLISFIKNFLYDNKIIIPQKVNAYVISVGNFTTGGVGKTPLVAEIAKYYIKNNKNVAIISRGYGGKLNNKNVNVISDGKNMYYNAIDAGDEPYWFSINLSSCAVLTCSDRYKAAKYAVEKLGISIIILDDGFQHRKLHRNLEIVLIDSEKMFGNGSLLPAGPLREGKEAFKRIDKLVVVSKNICHDKAEKLTRILAKKNNISTILCKTEPDYIYNIVSGTHLSKNSEAVALSAIGQPEQFYAFLERDYKIIKKITFDDHHHYTKSDIESIQDKIITTEKDAVKLTNFGYNNIYALKLKTNIEIENLLLN